MTKLWVDADKKGGVLFYPSNRMLGDEYSVKAFTNGSVHLLNNKLPEDFGINALIKYVKKNKEIPEFHANRAYINNNYLKEVPVFDEFNKRVTKLSEDENIINVLVPKSYKKYGKLLLDRIKYDHYRIKYFKVQADVNTDEVVYNLMNEHKNELKQNIIYIKDGQKFFTFSNEIPLSNRSKQFTGVPYADQAIFFVVNKKIIPKKDKEALIQPLGIGVYNNYMHYKINNKNNSINEIKEILDANGFKHRKIYYNNIFDSIKRSAENVKNLKIITGFFSVLFLVGLFFMEYVELMSYRSTNKKKINIKKFMGYRRIDIYMKYILLYLARYVITFIFLLIALVNPKIIVDEIYTYTEVWIGLNFNIFMSIFMLYVIFNSIMLYLFVRKVDKISIQDI